MLCNTTNDVVAGINPGIGLALTSVKTGSRFGKTILSYKNGGFYNPSLYFNAISTALSGTAFGLKGAAMLTSKVASKKVYCFRVHQIFFRVVQIH